MRESVFIIALAIAAFTLISVAKAIAGAISGRGQKSDLGQLKERLEQHTAALEDAENSLAIQSTQIAELQERLDFAERLLAQRRDPGALGPGENRG